MRDMEEAEFGPNLLEGGCSSEVEGGYSWNLEGGWSWNPQHNSRAGCYCTVRCDGVRQLAHHYALLVCWRATSRRSRVPNTRDRLAYASCRGCKTHTRLDYTPWRIFSSPSDH